MAVPELVRYFDLAGPVDADPLILQPQADAFGDLMTGFGQRVSINAWVVNAAGDKTPPLGLTISIAVAWVWKVNVDRVPVTTPASNDMWSRGTIAVGVTPGEELTQAELGDVVGFTAIVTAKSASPAGLRLAIYSTLGPRA